MNDSTTYSYVTWNQVKSIFNPAIYVQPKLTMGAAQLDFLTMYLTLATRCFKVVAIDKDAKHLHFIAPVLICVCSLLKGVVSIAVEEDLIG